MQEDSEHIEHRFLYRAGLHTVILDSPDSNPLFSITGDPLALLRHQGQMAQDPQGFVSNEKYKSSRHVGTLLMAEHRLVSGSNSRKITAILTDNENY